MATKSSSESYSLPLKFGGSLCSPLKASFEVYMFKMSSGVELLASPQFNKGSAFTHEERETFGLTGLLPSRVQTIDEQTQRAYRQYSSCGDDLAKNSFMTSLKEQNEVLYYRLIQDHLKEMLSIIYTPTEGAAISDFSRQFRRSEGCFLNIDEQDDIAKNLSQAKLPSDDVDIIVVSDGEQILGIGDQGVGAILISVAKLAIYTLCAGIHPDRTLPVVLDCGTNNEEFLKDGLYLGRRSERVRGQQYDDFVDKFISIARKQYPKAYIHFEDFGISNARRILDEYTTKIACFNDDVQGTGCVTLAAVYAGLKVAKLSLKDVRVLVVGAGTAGTGIADQISDAVALELQVPREEALKQFWCFDKPGLLLDSMKDDLTPAQHQYARKESDWQGKDTKDLASIVREVKPHILIGCSTKPKIFTELVVKEMAKHVDRPLIFPLSNPTKLHEATPADLIKWTDGRALISTGSPFNPVEHNGETHEIAECNNSMIFPGIGLGAILSRTKLISTPLLVAATQALAEQAPSRKDDRKGLLPDVTDARTVSVKVAAAVIRKAQEEGLAQAQSIPQGDGDLEDWIEQQMWRAEYRTLKKA
ncbi:hypothetical protein E4T50_04941 [Aureobasidium sp. EXF-12298]|nr:hypothetical protein E4T50_04941 [Aureobasidium sp. EXF-12298]KAI4763038.1 hypothetical protein E4T51_03968 [Aureobasidium sp. EXF-12344]KAI4780295.1 hypothetical protein E4T52_04829 [Aureobasidium sp. EXF-3400]